MDRSLLSHRSLYLYLIKPFTIFGIQKQNTEKKKDNNISLQKKYPKSLRFVH